MIVCEAAGYELILVETVGAGQNEVTVSEMTDFFLVLMLPGAGDELQGIKKGILELADMLVVNKADGDNERRAKQAKIAYRNALHIMRPTSPNWSPPVLTCSALKNDGLDAVWEKLREHKEKLTETGEIPAKRQRQRVRWMWATLENRLMDSFKSDPDIVSMLEDCETRVAKGDLTVSLAVDQLLGIFHKDNPRVS
jgi:LAO/AO transport system kinase